VLAHEHIYDAFRNKQDAQGNNSGADPQQNRAGDHSGRGFPDETKHPRQGFQAGGAVIPAECLY
jgi:hypothetical protein